MYAYVQDGTVQGLYGGPPEVFTRPDGSVVVGYDRSPEFWADDGWFPVETKGSTPAFDETATPVFDIKDGKVEQTYKDILPVLELKNVSALRILLINALESNRSLQVSDITKPDAAQTATKQLAAQCTQLIHVVLGLLDRTD